MRTTILAVTLIALPFLVQAQEPSHSHEHHAEKASAPADPPITITINPEARVSVKRGGELPPPVACGSVMELPVKIVNQGFVTAPLEASLVDHVPPGVRVEFSPEPLKGIPEERRILRVTLTKPELTDVTVSFRARNEIPDLGGRDRVHFLVRCSE